MKLLKYWYSAVILAMAHTLVSASPTSFSVCLKEKGVVLYSAWWCTYCFEQLKEIDPSFVDPVEMAYPERVATRFPFHKECGGDPNGLLPDCVPKKANFGAPAVPTIGLSDGTIHVGKMDTKKLSELTSCALP